MLCNLATMKNTSNNIYLFRLKAMAQHVFEHNKKMLQRQMIGIDHAAIVQGMLQQFFDH